MTVLCKNFSEPNAATVLCEDSPCEHLKQIVALLRMSKSPSRWCTDTVACNLTTFIHMLLPCFAETMSAHGVTFACRRSRNSLVYEARFLGATGRTRLLRDDFLLSTFLKDGIYNSEKKIRTSILMELDGTNFHVQFRFYTKTIENYTAGFLEFKYRLISYSFDN